MALYLTLFGVFASALLTSHLWMRTVILEDIETVSGVLMMISVFIMTVLVFGVNFGMLPKNPYLIEAFFLGGLFGGISGIFGAARFPGGERS